MVLSDWLQDLESLPSGLKNRSLDDLKSIAEKLNLLNFDSKIIVVAGTNGKGSTVVFLDSIFLAAGFTTGSYISPHVIRYNERIRLNGVDIDDDSLCQAFAHIKQVSGDIVLSYFEFTTLAALFLFKAKMPDVIILEVGLGGRFDPVNILDADLSIITTVSLDHTDILGKTRDDIGIEKSGIMRVSKSVICGNNMPDSIFKSVFDVGAKLYCLNKDFVYKDKDVGWQWQFEQTILENLPQVSLPVQSAALALMAVWLLSKDFKISYDAIIDGLKAAFLPGRFQRIEFNEKEIIFDVAHNEESANLFAVNLNKLVFRGRFLAVVGMLKDKDILGILRPLVGIVDSWYLGEVDDLRKASNDMVVQKLQELGVNHFSQFSTVGESLSRAIEECQENDRIIVFGSVRTVAEGIKRVYNSPGRIN